jgi:hypothetical protein
MRSCRRAEMALEMEQDRDIQTVDAASTMNH